jgi:hypothetical protein
LEDSAGGPGLATRAESSRTANPSAAPSNEIARSEPAAESRDGAADGSRLSSSQGDSRSSPSRIADPSHSVKQFSIQLPPLPTLTKGAKAVEELDLMSLRGWVASNLVGSLRSGDDGTEIRHHRGTVGRLFGLGESTACPADTAGPRADDARAKLTKASNAPCI